MRRPVQVSHVKRVSAGDSHAVLLMPEHGIVTFGNGGVGQLGLGDEEDAAVPKLILSMCRMSIVSVSAGSDHTLVLTRDGHIYSFGNNYSGQLGLGDTETRLEAVKVSREA